MPLVIPTWQFPAQNRTSITNKQYKRPSVTRAVHVKEVHGKHRRGLRVEKLPPGRIGAPPRRRRERLEDPADKGKAVEARFQGAGSAGLSRSSAAAKAGLGRAAGRTARTSRSARCTGIPRCRAA